MKTYSFQFFIYTLLIFAELVYSQEENLPKLIINPNPTNGIVNIEIRYVLPSGSRTFDTNIEVYTINGELITKRPIYGNLPGAGLYTISDKFYLNECSSGIYLIKVYIFGVLLVSRLMLLK